MKIPRYLTTILLSATIFACSGPAKEADKTIVEDSTAAGGVYDMPTESSFRLDLIIANNIAAPIKLLTDMNVAGLDNYQENVTNPTDRAEKYATMEQKALAFGVYGADLSYNSIYKKNEEMADYLIAIHKLSDDLGLASLFDQNAIENFDRIKTNPDSVRMYIFDKYDQADDYLRNNDRLVTATLILTGGLIESLHLVSHQIEAGDASKEAYSIFLEQKNTLKSLLELLNSLEAEGHKISVKNDIEMLQKKFSDMGSIDKFSKETISTLHLAVDEVRNKLVS